MTEMSLSAPAEFETPVLYGVEVEVDCRTMSIQSRRDIVDGVLAFWPSGNLMLDDCTVEITDGSGTPMIKHDPCKPWMKGML